MEGGGRKEIGREGRQPVAGGQRAMTFWVGWYSYEVAFGMGLLEAVWDIDSRVTVEALLLCFLEASGTHTPAPLCIKGSHL